MKYRILLAILLSALTSCYPKPNVPSDDQLRAKFAKETTNFEELASTAASDADKWIIARSFVIPAEPRIPDERIETYQRLFRVTGVKRVYRIANMEEALFFPLLESGNPSGGIIKGFVKSAQSIDTVESLDAVETSKRKGRYFAKLHDGWYLFFERD